MMSLPTCKSMENPFAPPIDILINNLDRKLPRIWRQKLKPFSNLEVVALEGDNWRLASVIKIQIVRIYFHVSQILFNILVWFLF